MECTVRCGRKKATGIAQLETEDIRFAGEWKLRIPFKEITELAVKDGELQVTHADGKAVFVLGDAAEKWAAKIRSPKGILDKLGVKSESRVLVLNVDDKGFLAQLKARAPMTTSKRGSEPCDLVMLGATDKKHLDQLGGLQQAIVPSGGIWVVWPKGRQELKEDDVRAAALAVGLVDVKVAKFSETHSALKLIIPLARRQGSGK